MTRGQFHLNFGLSSSDTQPQPRSARSGNLQNGGNLRLFQPEVFRFPSRRFCRFTMARVGFIGILFAVVLVIILGILGESFSNAQKSKPKVIVKRRKVGITTTTEAPSSSLGPLPEESGELEYLPRALESNLVLISVTGSSILLTSNETAQDKPIPEDSGPVPFEEGIDVNQTENGVGTTMRPDGCPGTCDKGNCPPIDCPIGLVMDRCSCCLACAVGEGARCYNSTDPVSAIGPDDGICGPGLFCIQRMDLEPGEPVEALCECRNSQRVCGSDNVTYSSECKLREASHTHRNLSLASWRPCISAPWLTTPMENVTGTIGEDVSLSCEFRSFPASIIHWEFSPDGRSEQRTVLPGDDSSIIQTNRGGPEEMMTTSWIQIVSITPRRQGTYFCFAKNTEGMSQSFAFISVHSQVKGTDLN